MDSYQFVYQEFDIMREQRGQPVSHVPDRVSLTPSRHISFPMRMQEARIHKRLTVDALATKCNMSIKDITNFESGAEMPTPAVMEEIKKVLELE